METKVDVIMGGGIYHANSICDAYSGNFPGVTDGRQYIIDQAQGTYDYSFVSDKSELEAIAPSLGKRGTVAKVLGMFEQNGIGGGKTPEMFRVDATETYPEGEPTLAEMTDAALDILEHDRNGMFLMIEGSQVDWEDHAQDVKGQIAESLGFDEAVKVVLDWINASQRRKEQTLLIVVADHETGGFAVNGPYGSLSKAGDIVEEGWTSGNHTAVDTIIYSQGPGSEKLSGAMDNTDLFYVMKDVLKKTR